MDKKIFKYKAKKTKLENDILNILGIKKANYENEIVNSNNNKLIIQEIEKFLNLLKLSKTSKLLIIVNGIYSVGKSTFINHLEKYIIKLSNIILNEQYIEGMIKHILLTDITDFNTDFNIDIIDKIIIIEINNSNFLNTNDIINDIKNKISETIQNIVYTITINIVPKDKQSLKNKYINKIIYDIKNNTTNFISGLIIDNNLINKNIQNNINKLILKNSIYSDNDFIFLNEVIDIVFNLELNKLFNEKNELSNIIKFYL